MALPLIDEFIAKHYDVSGGDADFDSIDISKYEFFDIRIIWSNLAGTLDGTVQLQQSKDQIVFTDLDEIRILDSKINAEFFPNVDITEKFFRAKFTQNGIVSGILNIQFIARATTVNKHLNDTDNPHQVTAAQVGKDTAQWNANKIKGKNIDALTTIGDLYVSDGMDVKRLPIGTNGQVLTADSSEALGLKWV